MARRILNRKDLRADFEAAERREAESEPAEDEEEESDDSDDDEDEAEDGEESEEAELAEGDEDEEEAPKKRKKKEPKPPKPKAKPRARSSKVVRLKVVWGVFNNSNQRVAVYDYPRRKEAEDHAAKLTADKKSTHFVQPIKEPMEEKKDS